MQVAGHELHHYQLPYGRPVKWYNSSETTAAFVALRLFSEGGACGMAEAPVKPTWSGLSSRALAALLEDLLLPALRSVDVSDHEAVERALAIFPGNQLAKMLVINACAVMVAAARKQPLWQLLGGRRSVEVSWCVTRQSPEAMAAEAEAMVGRYGFRTLKLKGGQGLAVDRAMLRAVRKTVGEEVLFTVDANAAYAREDGLDYVKMLADEGVTVAEDPCPLQPDAFFTDFVAASPLSILIDMPCVTAQDAAAFIAAGAKALSIKPGRIGFIEASRIARLAAEASVGVCAGMYAESALGTLISLQFSASLPKPLLPAEQTFYLLMESQILRQPLSLVAGTIELPAQADIDSLVDWTRTGLSVSAPAGFSR
jgi:L-alanine-DL-glutamate epimerase-like enolase superfamily enzyme